MVQLLSPVTLVNLSHLSGWLFPAANMPAVALFARHRPQRADQVTVVQVPWSPAGPKTHTFEIAPNDIVKLSLADWERQPIRLKAAAFGRRRDLLLLETLTSTYEGVGNGLAKIGARLQDGLILGKEPERTRHAENLRNLEILGPKDLEPFSVPEQLPRFANDRAQWPRTRDTYQAPLLLVKEFLIKRWEGRAVVAVAERDLIYTDAYFGAAFSQTQGDAAHLLAAILSSALASWFFIMTASEFGLWKQRLLLKDVELLPIPELGPAVRSDHGMRIIKLAQSLRQKTPRKEDWAALDEAVFDLYNLDATDRVVARDGLIRASWEWQPGREASVQSASTGTDLLLYTSTLLNVIDGWLSARNRRRMRAEIFDLDSSEALRVVRLILEEKSGPSKLEVIQPGGELTDLLTRIGQRLKVPLAHSIVGQRELRVHGRSEVVIIKPAARRHWMGVSALEDADSIIAESLT